MAIWVDKAVVLAIHDQQIAEHGGLPGLRDDNALESALARPRQLLAYGAPSIVHLAASYAFGLARNHAFIDGNKRVSLVVTEFSIASGEMDEADIATWLQSNSVRVS